MGSKLPVLAAVISLIAFAAPAAGDAGDLFKQGIDAYKAGKYKDAVAMLTKSYKLDPKPDALFALAQAERLSGNCDAAVKHYRKLLDSSTDLNTAKLVEQNLALCETISGVEKKEKEPDAKPEPKVVVKTEVRTDKLTMTLLAGGTLALGAAGGLYIASRTARSDATHARTFDDYQTLTDRADRDQLMAFIVGGLSAGMIGYAVVRWTRTPSEDSTTVSVAPSANATTVWVSGRF